MISNFGGMNGYTVYKTNDAGIVSVNPVEDRAPAAYPQRPQMQVKPVTSEQGIKDTYDNRAQQSPDQNISDKELKNIRRLLEEISAKLTTAPAASRASEAAAFTPQETTQKAEPRGEVLPPSIRPIVRNDISAYNQVYGYRNPGESAQSDGPYNVLQACKNLNAWAKTEYAQTEGFDTTYSPQEFRDRISILDEIQNHINSVPGYVPPAKESKNAPIIDRNMATYKAMKKDPDRITRRTYFEATV